MWYVYFLQGAGWRTGYASACRRRRPTKPSPARAERNSGSAAGRGTTPRERKNPVRRQGRPYRSPSGVRLSLSCGTSIFSRGRAGERVTRPPVAAAGRRSPARRGPRGTAAARREGGRPPGSGRTRFAGKAGPTGLPQAFDGIGLPLTEEHSDGDQGGEGADEPDHNGDFLQSFHGNLLLQPWSAAARFGRLPTLHEPTCT